jgi:PKD repeat protein
MAALSLVVAACGDDDNGGGPDNQDPVASYTFECELLVCTFTDTSQDPDGNADITARHWDFGGDGESDEQNPTHTFSAASTYQVVLTVTDAAGATSTQEQAVTVSTTPGNQPPVAAFTFECSALECTFTDASTDADGTIASYLWDFGDGETSIEASPTHTYAAAGEVTVNLTVTDDAGDTGETSQTFDVSNPSGLECADGTPDCELTIEADAKVTVTLESSDCELSGNTFKVVITPPGEAPVEETLFTDGCNTPDGTSFQLQSDAVIVAGTVITAQLISGGSDLQIPPALRLTPTSAYPNWTLEFDDGAIGPETDPAEPDFNDLIITIVATPQ